MLNTFFRITFFILMLLSLLSLNTLKYTSKKQGICGHVYRISGNRMPSPDIKLPPPEPFATTVYIYERTNINQVVRQGSSAFYSFIKTRLIKKVQSDTSGYFEAFLPPGHYSLFTAKDTLFYSNWFDKDNNIAPAEVKPGKMTQVEIRVDYDAAY